MSPGAMLAQQPGRRPAAAPSKRLDAVHRGDQRRLRGLRQRGEQRADLLARTCVERGEGVAAGRGQRQQALAPVGGGWRAREQAVALEALQDAAEIAGIELQFAAELGGGEAGALGQFVEHARLGEREAALQQAFLQGADGARVEAVEPADGGDAMREGWSLAMPVVIRLVDLVKQYA